jgi:hypothetical protein
MPFAATLAAIFLIGLSGRRASRGTYVAVAFVAGLASLWQYLK